MEIHTAANFKRNYERHLQHLKLKGLQPKTIAAYSRSIRQAGEHFELRIDDLSAQQLTDYFSERLATHSWSAVKLDWYGLRFYYEHVLAKPWCYVPQYFRLFDSPYSRAGNRDRPVLS